MKRVLLPLVLSVSLSCLDNGPIGVRFDASVPAHKQAVIVRAMAPWNNVTLPSSQLVQDPSGEYLVLLRDRVIYRGDSEHYNGLECTYGGPDCGGVKNTIQIRADLSESDTYAVAEHEFGHALGMRHNPNGKPGVMNATVTQTDFTRWDLANCLDVGACGSITIRPAP